MANKTCTRLVCIVLLFLSLFAQSQSINSAAGCGRFVYWVRGGYYVEDANLVQGGREAETYGRGFPFYICRVQHEGSTFVGKFIKSARESEANPSQCWFSDGSNDHVHEKPAEYDVLVDLSPGEANSVAWEEPQTYHDGPGAPLDSFWAGQSNEGRSIYIGQCTIVLGSISTVIPGSVDGGSGDTMTVAFNNESPSCKVEKFLTCLNYAL